MRCCFFVLIALGLLSACVKKREIIPEPEIVLVNTGLSKGFTDNPGEINGFLSSAYRISAVPSETYTGLWGYASFGEPRRALMKKGDLFSGNVSVGRVLCFNYTLTPLVLDKNYTYVTYTNHSAEDFNYDSHWEIEGNRSFTGFITNIPSAFPFFDTSKTIHAIAISKGVSFLCDQFIDSYDSAKITIYSDQGRITRAIGWPNKVLSFDSTELSSMKSLSSSCIVSYSAVAYYNQTLDSKVYVYECQNMYRHKVSVTP